MQSMLRAQYVMVSLNVPQVLHYKVDSMQEKVAYLRSIGMSPSQVGVVLQVGRHSSTSPRPSSPCFHVVAATCCNLWTAADGCQKN